MKELGVYIHIPFCKQKCLYCDFVSFANKEEKQREYVEAMKKEIENWKKLNKDYKIKTIYIGGGTPSYIDSKYIIDIFKTLDISPNRTNDTKKTQIDEISITIEINPGTITKQKLEDYKNAGVNRLSIGLQSTKDELLKQIGRIHNYQQFIETYNLARKIGFKNINVDLMLGLPNQSIADLKDSLEKICKLNPEHISVYSLIVEDDTPIQKLIDTGKLELPDEEAERQMYWYVKNFLELKGYKHYEISNFAKPGFESKHNLDCWNQKEYIGFGVAAYSYIDNKRFGNISNMEEYIKNCNTQNFEKNIITEEVQDKTQKMNEYMILGLRKIDGISIQEFERIFNENPIMLYRKELKKLYEEKLISIDGDRIKLSNKGLDLANLVWEEFV
ncbi:MAG: oxygen-independent coproporphyrinogen III oxidase [Clostridia bacterium]|nr:oxygen-independent coproporphyrinogen III oxidase [Clostridia bacterium]